MPNKKTLKKCWENNRDGAGYMFPSEDNVVIKKGFMKWDEFYKSLMADLKRYGEFTPFVLHFRIQTQGGVNKECTHPFPLSDNMEHLKKLRVKTDIGVAHNGIIDLTTVGYKTQVTYSDTMKFITDYLSLIIQDRTYHNNPDTLLLIERLIDSKMAIMDGSGHTELIGEFIKDDGCYYSNGYYKESRYKWAKTTTQPTTTTYYNYSRCQYNNGLKEEDLVDDYANYLDPITGQYYFDPVYACPKNDYDTNCMCDKCYRKQFCKTRWEE